MPPLPPLTQFLMLACTAIFCLQFFAPLAQLFALFPVGSGLFQPWQLVTYSLIHLDFVSLMFGMLALWMFGGEFELAWGKRRYAAFLFAGVLSSAVLFLVLSLFVNGVLVGSYSAMYALLAAAAISYPNRVVTPLIPPIPMKMKTFAAVFAGIGLLISMVNGIGSLAHLGGMVGGALTIAYWRGRPPFGRRR